MTIQDPSRIRSNIAKNVTTISILVSNLLKIVENFDFSGWYSKDISDEVESEDTMSILNRYIEEAEVNLDKSIIQKMMQEVYQEACEMI